MHAKGHLTVLVLTIAFIAVSLGGCGPKGATPRSPLASPQVSTDGESAHEALMAFFSLLHDQRYSEAINYYGGPYDVLRDWNPGVAPADHAALFRNGCTVNGLRCLRIRGILQEEEVAPAEFRLTVEFMDDDGNLFSLGPCCGATGTEMPAQAQFTYTVKKVDSRFLVQELPVYVP